ncbi:MAG: hypothetical protein CVU64_02465 [Deltaproteobacteria bacterium HGW-Deltaproteobacteria-21]|nr:MAG: hypothetical protein CVU64_02465 [Deltaproteobacteria bacterium HGW-Deltaproteobacteria-21]
MQSIIYSLKATLTFNKFPLLTILANIFLGYAFGKILVTPGNEVGGSILIQAFLIIGTCFFANYLLCLRKAFKGINRSTNGKLRPFLREALLCGALNVCIFLPCIALFFIKSHGLVNL